MEDTAQVAASRMERHLVPALTHGVTLIRPAHAGASRGVLIGFHGYMESAAIQMERLIAVPGASRWTLVAVEGLHRVYRGRSQDVVASWMTSADREVAIADNLAYVEAALGDVPHDSTTRIVYCGFSQGVAMAFRAGLLGAAAASAIVAVGGDVPPELLADGSLIYPPILFTRGVRDEWLTQAKFDANLSALHARGAPADPLTYDGAHEWNAEVSAAIAGFLDRIAPARERSQT